MVNISNCPHTGMKRKVIDRKLLIDPMVRQVVLTCIVGYFDANDVELSGSAPGVNRYTKPLVASTDKVNPSTGVTLTEEELANNNPWVYEIDFFLALKNMPIKINELEVSEIQTSDIEGKFNFI